MANKFNFVKDVAQSRTSEITEPPDSQQVSNTYPVDNAAQGVKQKSPEVDATRKTGRPRGKRSDPNYEQVTAYIKKDTYRQVKIALLESTQGQEFSELIQELLDEFLRTQKFK